MINTLSIRSYSRQKVKHFHPYHQLVFPLRGIINIELGGYTGKVSPGECVIIKAENIHHFTAENHARFIVADLDLLPSNLAHSNILVFSISQPLLRFLDFIEAQLKHQVNQALEQLCFNTFYGLLSEQTLSKTIDKRIREAIEYIEANITSSLSINTLSSIACLSPTQFKKLFKIQIGLTANQYVIKRRMEKAHALLLHTDTPIQIVAEQTGYNDYTAFSRRFCQYFGLSPSKVCP